MFCICKSIIQLKSVQVNEALKQLNEQTDDVISSPRHFSRGPHLPNKVKECHQLILHLQSELEEKQSSLSKVNDEVKQLTKSLEITSRERDIMKSEMETLTSELDRREDSDDFFTENRGHLEKIREKNQQITHLLDELRQLEEKNASLSSKVSTLSTSLNKATYEIETCTEDMKKIRDQQQVHLEMNKKLLKEKEILLSQLKSLKDKVEFYEEEDLSSKLATRIDEVIDLIEEKDSQIYRLKKQLRQFTEEPFKSNVIKPETPPSKFTFDSIEQGNNLRIYLQDAARLMDEQNELIESLKEQVRKNKSLSESTNSLNELGKLSTQLSAGQMDSLESELLAKDGEISELRKQLFIYENQYFGLKEATAELKKSRQKEVQLEERIHELTNELNQLHMELTDTQDELDYIRECAKVKGIDTEFVPRNKDSRQDKLEILKLQQQLIRLEEEKIDLQEKVRILARAPIDETIDLIPSKTKEDEVQLQELKEQNEALQLGMKEILLALQRSDSNSDTVLDCPTLERLCQVLESRTVSPSLAPMIALKAELDLVRGNNEQLREELKRIRQEHLSLLAIYTEEILGNTSITTELDTSNISHLQPSEGEVFIKTNEDTFSFDDSKSVKVNDGQINKQASEEEEVSEHSHPGQVAKTLEGRDKKVSFEEEEGHEIIYEEEDGKVDAEKDTFSVSAACDEDETGQAAIVEEKNSDDEDVCKGPVDGGDDYNFQRQLIELKDAETQVQLPVIEKKIATIDVAVGTEVPEPNWSPRVVEKCAKCIVLSRTIKELMDRLIRLEERIKTCDEDTRHKVKVVQEYYSKREGELNEQVKQLQSQQAQKDLLIESLKEREPVPKRSNRRETHVISKSDSSPPDSSASPAIFALPDISSALSTGTSTNVKSSMAAIFEGVVECLESRIEHKESFIKEYEKRIQEAKESFEREVQSVISKLEANNVADSRDDSFKILLENEMLKSRVEGLMSQLTHLKSESSDKMQLLERQVENEKNKLQQTEKALESASKRCSFNQMVTMRNEVNHLREEVKAKESVIESLHKRLQEERRSRIATTKIKVKQSPGNEWSANTMTSFVDHLKSQLEAKEKQVKQIELAKWTGDKKYQEKIQELLRKLDHERDEKGKLEQMVKRMKFILEKKTAPAEKSSEKKSTRTSASCLTTSEPGQKAKSKETGERENELRILLQESLKREKVAVLRLMSANAPEINVEENLLQENAKLKVDLRMAQFELSALSASADSR